MKSRIQKIGEKFARRTGKFPLYVRKARWAISHDNRGEINPLFILGVQRSGTSILIKQLERCLDVRTYTETQHSPAYDKFRLRDLETIKALCRKSRQKIIAFKPLTDSHRAQEFLSLSDTSKILWMFRKANDRANSAVARFGAHNSRILAQFSRGEGLDRWQAQGLSEQSVAFIKQFDYEKSNAETAAAIFWYVRNQLFFEQGLDKEDRVLTVCYETLAQEPAASFVRICSFLDCEYHPRIGDGIHARSVGKSVSKLDSAAEARCDELYEQLRVISTRQ